MKCHCATGSLHALTGRKQLEVSRFFTDHPVHTIISTQCHRIAMCKPFQKLFSYQMTFKRKEDPSSWRIAMRRNTSSFVKSKMVRLATEKRNILDNEYLHELMADTLLIGITTVRSSLPE